MGRLLLLLILLPPWLAGQEGKAARTAVALLAAKLDAGECYRVRDLRFAKEDVRLFLTDGYLIFAQPVEGRRVAAVFTAEVEGGDAEILVLPPHRGERLALANFTGAPNLDEHFRSAVMVFTDGTAQELMAQIEERQKEAPESPGKSPELGALFAEAWSPMLRNFLASFEVRVVENILSSRPAGESFFYAALAGRQLDNFDFIFDPRSRDQITLGQVAYRDSRTFFDIWTSFESRSYRRGERQRPGPELIVNSVHIDAALDNDLRLRATTTLTITPKLRIAAALPLDISRKVRVLEAKVDGVPAEVFQPESLRANLIRGSDNATFLVVPAQPLEAGRTSKVEILHEGDVVSPAGDGVYFVASRATWYPNREVQFAPYDITFRYPKTLDLVATGDVTEDRTEGDWRITRRQTSAPIRFAGFNLGQYLNAAASQGGYTVEVYGNRSQEAAFQSQPREPVLTPLPQQQVWPRGPRKELPVLLPPPPETRTITFPERLSQLASEVASALDFLASRFGPPPSPRLTVSPIPGSFGQGFPGLIYLSTLSYLPPGRRAVSVRARPEDLFYSDTLQVHEAAHQWWGNVVATSDYQDDWLMEALASYSSLLYLEKKKGTRAMENMLEEYKRRLLSKDEEGKPVESAGPITWSLRLSSSLSPAAWRIITYDKGSWIIHMLRRRMGDQQFWAMLTEACRRYRFSAITTQQFRQLAEEYLPKNAPERSLENFFEQWVYGTGIPTLKLSFSVKGKAPAVRLTGTVKQSDVPEDFSALVPVEIQFANAKPMVRWVRTGDDAGTFAVGLKQPPLKVLLDPSGAVLARK